MRSIFLDYYIGSLLLWKGKEETFEVLACEPIHGFPDNIIGEKQHIVLDGQQRLTAIYYALFAPPDVTFKSRTNPCHYFIRVDKFMEEYHDEAFVYEWAKHRRNHLGDRKAQYSDHYFPLSVIGQTGWELANWVQGYIKYWADQNDDSSDGSKSIQYADYAEVFGEYLKDITEQYQVSYIELDSDLDIAKVCDIFTQINSSGIRLDIFDLFNAMLRPKGLYLKQMWREAKPKLDFIKAERMDVYVLQVMSILVQTYCSAKYLYYLLPNKQKPVRKSDGTIGQEILITDIDSFEIHWNEAVRALEAGMSLLNNPREFGVVTDKYLPYLSILPVFSALQADINKLDSSKILNAQIKFKKWYWASVFSNRYSKSSETTAARDFLDITNWFDNDDNEPDCITEFDSHFDLVDLKRERRGKPIYNGIFNLLVRHGAQDWITGTSPSHSKLDDHHIVPRKWGRENGLVSEIDVISNRTPLTSKTNRKIIGNKLPNEYLPKLIESNGEDSLRAILETHYISPKAFDILLHDPFTTKDFEDFINERTNTIRTAIINLFSEEIKDLPADLKGLDRQVEEIELSLRSLISRRLLGASKDIPQHINQRIQDRIQRSFTKNPAVNADHYSTVEGQMEYADLRDLETIIINKDLWHVFEDIFKNKDSLANRFNQLAELRNCIRHSRAVDEITKKDGEVAILWFNQILKMSG